MKLLKQILKQGADPRNIMISGNEMVTELWETENTALIENMVFESDEELYETIEIVAKYPKVVFWNCEFQGRFTQVKDFIRDLAIIDLNIENCKFTPELAIKLVQQLILPSNFNGKLMNLTLTDLCNMSDEESKRGEIEGLLGKAVIYNFLPFEWELTRTIPPMVFIDDNKTAWTESDGYRTFFLNW